MAKTDLEQSKIVEAISFFRDLLVQSPESNSKIIDYVKLAERQLQEELYQLLIQKTNKTKKGGK